MRRHARGGKAVARRRERQRLVSVCVCVRVCEGGREGEREREREREREVPAASGGERLRTGHYLFQSFGPALSFLVPLLLLAPALSFPVPLLLFGDSWLMGL